MKIKIASLADLPGALVARHSPPPAPKPRSKAALDIENLRLNKTASGFAIRGQLAIRKVKAGVVIEDIKFEVTGFGFTTGRAAHSLFRDAIKFVPKGTLTVRYPVITPAMIAELS